MDACVRSAGPVDSHRPSGDARKRAFQMILDSVAVSLALPARERRSIISDDEFQSSWHRDLVSSDQGTVIGRNTSDRTSLITFGRHGRGAAVEIALQNHLSSHLIYVSARLSCRLARVAQRPMRCGGGQPFVPGDDWAR